MAAQNPVFATIWCMSPDNKGWYALQTFDFAAEKKLQPKLSTTELIAIVEDHVYDFRRCCEQAAEDMKGTTVTVLYYDTVPGDGIGAPPH